uniref:AAA_12 domain-containing protein n=1 Tax=Haemonchus placei TaxID=6290 RepID=A0A0N4WF32_HAEPC
MRITTASLLNTTKLRRLFFGRVINEQSDRRRASQIPEHSLVAMLRRFPLTKHIYIGDVNRLKPHVRSPRSSQAARLGAKGVTELLMAKEIPLVQLVATYRAHPVLNALPNRLVYDRDLVSGTPARRRQMLTRYFRLLNPELPLVVIDVPSRSRLSPSRSHFNEQEAQCCKELICGLLSKDIPATLIGAINFYKDRQRLMEDTAAKLGVHFFTVDFVQEREMDIVVILTTRTTVDRFQENS